MSSLKDLLQQREQLNAQIEQARQSELSEALAKVHATAKIGRASCRERV